MITKIQQTREIFHLSQRYVANYLNIPLHDYMMIEQGLKPITSSQIQKLNILYGTKTEQLLSTKKTTDDEKITQLLRFLDL